MPIAVERSLLNCCNTSKSIFKRESNRREPPYSRNKKRGTSVHPRHTWLTRYRCSLPGLAGFAGPRCTEPEVPRFNSRTFPDCLINVITARRVYQLFGHSTDTPTRSVAKANFGAGDERV